MINLFMALAISFALAESSAISEGPDNSGNHLKGFRCCFLAISPGQGVSALVILLSWRLFDMKQRTN